MTATLAGKGKFYGDMQLAAAGDDEFTTTVRLTSVNDGSTLSRTGRTAVYGGHVASICVNKFC